MSNRKEVRISANEKWKEVISFILAFEGTIQNASDDRDEKEVSRIQAQRLKMLKQAYNLNFKPNVRPNWAIKKIEGKKNG